MVNTVKPADRKRESHTDSFTFRGIPRKAARIPGLEPPISSHERLRRGGRQTHVQCSLHKSRRALGACSPALTAVQSMSLREPGARAEK